MALARYFIRLSYCGTAYHGWQTQANDAQLTVQGVLAKALSLYLRTEVEVTGCGRTDAGVHARDYTAHIDVPALTDIPTLLHRVNRMLPDDIAIHNVCPVHDQAHARFDAVSRSYEYHLHTSKDPFAIQSFYYTYGKPDVEVLNEAAQLLLAYTDFYTFCKTHTDVQTTLCHLTRSEWVQSGDQYIYRVSADRFLRGMIRLIVGMCLNIDRGRLSLDGVRRALESRSRLPDDWSVPAHGLFLCDIRYPDRISLGIP